MLAGRDARRLRPLAEKLGLAWRVFGLDDTDAVTAALHDISLVVHCAGPFSTTARPMLAACLQARTHYLDITGEISVLEQARGLDTAARAAEIVLCPGTGFDVIPTDCLARTLAAELPDAVHLDLAFAGGKSLSPGTAKTTIEGLTRGVTTREHGHLRTHGAGRLQRQIDFGRGPCRTTAIPWGDVATAYASTGIPNIRVFTPASARTIRRMRLAYALRPLLRLGLIQALLKNRIARTVHGPDAQTRLQQRMTLWGEVRNANGDWVRGRIETPNGYDITTWGPVHIAEHILGGAHAGAGYTTPSLLMGADFLTRIPDVGRLHLQHGSAGDAEPAPSPD